MKILRAERVGFCFGVRRAARMVDELSGTAPDGLCTLGPLIHNRQEVERLERLGVRVCASLDECVGGTAIVRTHGIERAEQQRAAAEGVTLVDATCPHVKFPRRRIQQYGQGGRTVILIGDRRHPEVAAQVTYAEGPIHVIASRDQIPDLPPATPIGVVAQTTLSEAVFADILAAVQARFANTVWEDTICEDTRIRQEEVQALAAEVDCLIVVGGRNSANTRRLTELGAAVQPRTYQVETADELSDLDLRQVRLVGVTSGASTPDWIIAAIEDGLASM